MHMDAYISPLRDCLYLSECVHAKGRLHRMLRMHTASPGKERERIHAWRCPGDSFCAQAQAPFDPSGNKRGAQNAGGSLMHAWHGSRLAALAFHFASRMWLPVGAICRSTT